MPVRIRHSLTDSCTFSKILRSLAVPLVELCSIILVVRLAAHHANPRSIADPRHLAEHPVALLVVQLAAVVHPCGSVSF